MEGDALRDHAPHLTVKRDRRRLTYQHAALRVPGRHTPAQVRIEFWADAPETYGLPPQDYPTVRVDPSLPSPHRMPDRSLCLFYPDDPPERRWIAHRDGLNTLLVLIEHHLFAEDVWRMSGGEHGGVWVLDEAPHGLREDERR
ncbi:MAG TPA: hypothetical protein VGC37_08695 [Friedmanniella sp.]